jgi:hypothetical protein
MTVLLRFADLKARNIVHSWTQLKHLKDREGFPLGFMLSPGCRCWTEAEIERWLAARPTEGPELRGAAKNRQGNPGKRKTETTAIAE